jgi:putative tryptophan/tyrosine transport system substrate-binding protein
VVDSSFERLRGLAAELVGLKVDVIAASGNATIEALMQATTTIPIVMISSGDPVGAGFVRSLARPGGNVSGLANLAEGLSVKWLELLTQSVPGITRVGVVMVPNTPAHATYLGEIKAAAQRTASPSMGWKCEDGTRSRARSPRSRKRMPRASWCCRIPSR